jgi:hypothetical protein
VKQERREKKEGMLIKGKAAGTRAGMEHNYDVMRKAGYSKKRSEGTAYGEVGMEKMARRHESEGMKRREEKLRESPSTKHRRGEC